MYTLQRKLFTQIQSADQRYVKAGLGVGLISSSLVMPASASAASAECDEFTTNIVKLIQDLILWISMLAGIIVVIMFVIAGIEWMSAGGNMQKVQKAQNRLKNATIGLVIIGLAWLIRDVVLDLVGGSTDKGKAGQTALEKCDTAAGV